MLHVLFLKEEEMHIRPNLEIIKDKPDVEPDAISLISHFTAKKSGILEAFSEERLITGTTGPMKYMATNSPLWDYGMDKIILCVDEFNSRIVYIDENGNLQEQVYAQGLKDQEDRI